MGTLSLEGEGERLQYSLLEGSSCRSAEVIGYLDALASETERVEEEVVVVLDNAPFHTAGAVLRARGGLGKRWGLSLYRLPAYCPHLNLIEGVWRKGQGFPHGSRRFYDSVGELKEAVLAAKTSTRRDGDSYSTWRYLATGTTSSRSPSCSSSRWPTSRPSRPTTASPSSPAGLRLAEPAGKRRRRAGGPLPPRPRRTRQAAGDARAKSSRRRSPRSRTRPRSAAADRGPDRPREVDVELDADVKGDIYEGLLAKSAADAKRGPASTSRPASSSRPSWT